MHRIKILLGSKVEITNWRVVIERAVGHDAIDFLVLLEQVDGDDITGLAHLIIDTFVHCFVGLAVNDRVPPKFQRAIIHIVTTSGVGRYFKLIILPYTIHPLHALTHEGDVLVFLRHRLGHAQQGKN